MYQVISAGHSNLWASVIIPPGRSFLEREVGRECNRMIERDVDTRRQSGLQVLSGDQFVISQPPSLQPVEAAG